MRPLLYKGVAVSGKVVRSKLVVPMDLSLLVGKSVMHGDKTFTHIIYILCTMSLI